MSTYVHQNNRPPIKVNGFASNKGTELGISQRINEETGQYAEIRISIDALPELISALQEELNFLRPPVEVGKHAVGTRGTDPNQGQLFDPDDYS